MDWIAERARREDLISAKAESLWNALRTALSRDLDSFNEHFSKLGRGCVMTASDICFSNLAVNQNVEPCPSTLRTPIFPPIISTSCLEIARPNPVPPYLRVVEPSAWVKAWNRFR